MGLGKTMQVLLAMGDRGLVFCPASVKGVWAREAARWRPDLTVVVCEGRGSFRWPEAGELVVINYDVVKVEDVEAAGKPHAGCGSGRYGRTPARFATGSTRGRPRSPRRPRSA